MEILLFIPIIAIIVIAIFVINSGVLFSKKERFTKFVEDNIDRLGLQQSIIKRTDAELFQGIVWSNPQGVLLLTWDTLHYIGKDQRILQFPIHSIRSTSYEHNFNRSILALFTDSGTHKFSWPDNLHPAAGVGIASGGQGGVGFGSTTSANPIVQEWIGIIDDLRFGRLRKPL